MNGSTGTLIRFYVCEKAGVGSNSLEQYMIPEQTDPICGSSDEASFWMLNLGSCV